jgi:signal peptidase I
MDPSGNSMFVNKPDDVSGALNSANAVHSAGFGLDVTEEKQKKAKSKTYELFQIAMFALLFAYVIRVFFIQAFKIPTGSMEDTLLIGDLLLVNKFIYGAKTPETLPFTDIRIPQLQLPSIRDPKPGDVVIFKFPPDPTVDYIKRCVAVAGQTVEIKDKVVYVDHVPFKEIKDPPGLKFEDPEMIPRDKGYESIVPRGAGSRDNYGPITVPDRHLFVMGDNRDRSYDSRQWGFVPMENVIGKALIIYWSTASENNFDIRWPRVGKIVE